MFRNTIAEQANEDPLHLLEVFDCTHSNGARRFFLRGDICKGAEFYEKEWIRDTAAAFLRCAAKSISISSSMLMLSVLQTSSNVSK